MTPIDDLTRFARPKRDCGDTSVTIGEHFLKLCEGYLALAEEHGRLLSRMSEAELRCDPGEMDKLLEALEDNDAERRVLLWRIQEGTRSPTTADLQS